ncbi:4-alpha-glucanotransferase [Altererythrobacter sp. B11]|uniref:4-alpha-glucanotransferase n=1 Tax=Altererythrobacter sp. B11 TaxID=2060312 RepID=UPI000DC731B7|nr:4-alpha-glucanotransferase [Altererythrobacter sp. B11]BBC73443.1 4-alpha-glucanotransferase [Altererythrobacter sp. B11]
MSDLATLARAAGLQIDWTDAAGHAQHVSDEALRSVLSALGYPAESDRMIGESLAKCRSEEAACSFLSADRGQPIPLPPGCGTPGEAEIILENGEAITVPIERGKDGLSLSAVDAVGYHRLRLSSRELLLAVAPERCLRPRDLCERPRSWGAAVQTPSLRSDAQRPYGDFAALAEAARSFGRTGADALAISPAHALFPGDPARFSPYAPSSRLFLNILLGDPALVGHAPAAGEQSELIDWDAAIPRRMADLRQAFAQLGDAQRREFETWRMQQGEELERHAIFDALFEHYALSGAGGWQGWPDEYHDPAGAAVALFAQQHAEDVSFYAFAQWLAATSLDAAHQAARDSGMTIGIIADLAVGMDGGGSHAWSRREELLTGLSIGAPPDLLGPQGQNWGLTSFSPAALKRTGFAAFIATLRAAFDHAGGVRIDHILGLSRLWVIPHGAASGEGAYLTYPTEDMLRILAIESHRARGIVIGEDLGTVPEGLRPRLERRGVLGMRVLWFEQTDDGDFLPPAAWDEEAVAMSGTHDLFTLAGWWSERDIDWNRKLFRSPAGVTEAEERATRGADRKRLWGALLHSGAASGALPPADEPGAFVEAALAHVASAPCELAILPLEDLAGLREQPNLPGTTDEHPNWRRRMPDTTPALLARPDVIRRIARVDEARR